MKTVKKWRQQNQISETNVTGEKSTIKRNQRWYEKEKKKSKHAEFSFGGMTSTPRRALTNSATSAMSKLRATKPLFPRFPKSMSGLTTTFVDDNQGWWSVNSAKSVDCVTCEESKSGTELSNKWWIELKWGDSMQIMETWAERMSRSIEASRLRCSLRSLLEWYSLIFFLAILRSQTQMRNTEYVLCALLSYHALWEQGRRTA